MRTAAIVNGTGRSGEKNPIQLKGTANRPMKPVIQIARAILRPESSRLPNSFHG
jgi:hypothetical protein